MAWFGGALIGSFLPAPTAKALGRQAQPFMDHLAKRRRIGVYSPIIAALTILSGAALYWRDSGGLQVSWITTPTGLGFSMGALAGIATFIGGAVLVWPNIAAQTAVQNELAISVAAATDVQRGRLARAGRQMQLADRIDRPLIVTAGVMMAVARYH